MEQKRKMVVTAALIYANGDVHLGHLVEYIQTDFWTRFQKMRGHECLYICADDTHGTPIMIKAREEGIAPEALIARVREQHLRDFGGFEIEFDNFGSTNQPENQEICNRIYQKMLEHKNIHTENIEQAYCEHDKMFLPDRFVKGTCPKCGALDQHGDNCDVCSSTYTPTEMKDAHCVICGSTPVMKSSEHLFFKLGEFKSFLQEWVPVHTPKEVANKMQEWLSGDLRNWDISRDKPYFGFEIPGKPGKYFYVWMDAPCGYVASTEEWCQRNGKNLEDYWGPKAKGEIYHFIGKDIVYFHTLFWPAMLKTAEMKLPNQIFVHGHLTINGQKMGKSKGTFINAETYLKHLDPMYLRYYYASKLSSSVEDVDLSFDDFVNRVNSDLVGKITNLASRGAQMLSKRIDGQLGTLQGEGLELVKKAQAKAVVIAEHYENRDFSKAIKEIRELADDANKYFDEKAPWKMIAEDVEGTRVVLTTILNVFRLMAIYLKPVLPQYVARVEKLFNEKPYTWDSCQMILQNHKISDYEHLASRVEMTSVNKIVEDTKADYERMLKKKEGHGKGAATVSKDTTPATPTKYISYDDFAKVELRVAKVLEAEAIEGADKLLRLKVDIGEEQKSIIAGIKSAYAPEKLVGRHVAVVVNLEPRKMKFGVSEGMVLAAGPGGNELFVLSPDEGAKAGMKIK